MAWCVRQGFTAEESWAAIADDMTEDEVCTECKKGLALHPAAPGKLQSKLGNTSSPMTFCVSM